MNKIDLLDVLPQVKPGDFVEGTNAIDYFLPDGRSVTLEYNYEINGYTHHPFDDPDGLGTFIGGFDFELRSWTGYDNEGNEIPVINNELFVTIVKNKL